ncbi:MAG: type IV pilus secretin PilQ [Thermoanaerobaculaceae bacterium]|jgi:type IV pilus assembly protein PilQ
MKATATRSLIAVVAMGVLTGLLLPGVVAGQEAVSILGMAWTPKPAPALVISASGPLTFTKAQPEPGVLIVEFPEAALAKPLPAVEEPAAGLRRASVSAVEEGGKHWVRLRVEIDMNASVSVSALPSGIEVRVAQAQELSRAPRAGELGDVLAVADATGVSVHLAGQGSFESKAFTLENPPRIVVDLKGVVNRLARRVQPVGAAGVERVRVAQFATAPEPVVRVVVDLDKPLPYHIEPTADGALLRVGGEQAQVAEAPAAAAPAAVQVAEAPAVAKPEPEPTKAEPVAAKAEPEPTKAEPAAAKAESVAAKAESETPAAAPVTAKAETPAAPVTPAAEQAAAIPQTPVKIVDEPPPAVQPQPKAAPAEAPPSGSLTTPPAAPAGPAHKASPADSPWTTTPAAMAEQAAPPTAVATGSHELESQEKRFTGEPISLELKDADIKDVLRTFAKITGLNVVVDPGVSGSVTVNLENVPWDQCLDIILRVNGLDYVVENNVLRVARIQQLTAEKSQQAMLRKESENAKPMRTVAKTLSYAKASAVKAVLTSQGFILSDRGSVVVDDRTNQLIIRDATDKLEGILNLIDSLDQANPQVIIEARVVETTKTFSKALGMTWGYNASADAAHGTTTGLTFPNYITSSGNVSLAQPGNGTVSITMGNILDSFNLDFTLTAAEANGLAKVVSSPKVTAQNNEKAHIQSGTLLPIQTVANNTVTVQYVDATLSLDVTPQITAEGTVLLDIDLKKREPLAGINLQSATNVPITTRDAKTRVMVRDGGTTVIGGIYQLTDNDQMNGIPFLDGLPIIGALFKNRAVSTEHDELLIFITPRIVKY